MAQEYLFVSCDIVAHSLEPSQVQMDRVAAINSIVGATLGKWSKGDIVWASGGDGGHVAVPQGCETIAVELIVALKEWSLTKGVPLRISANVGIVDSFEGADGRKQLVGTGINLAGSLVPLAGPSRVLVSVEFRDKVTGNAPPDCVFHDERLMKLKNLPAERVCLFSRPGRFESLWDETSVFSDRTRLRNALNKGDGLGVVYRARRLFDSNSKDTDALDALRTLAWKRNSFLRQDGFIESLFIDQEIAPNLIRAADLVERRTGEIVCEKDDDGETMFWVLTGRLGGIRTTLDPQIQVLSRKPDFVTEAGGLAGELAFSLRRKRTATLYCLEDSSFLAFDYEQLLLACPDTLTRAKLEQTLGREINAKILENVWNEAPYFCRRDGAELLIKMVAPWLTLLPFTTRTRLSWDEEEIGSDHPVFEPKTLSILIAGRITVRENPAITLDGIAYPLLFVDSPGGRRTTLGTYQLLSDIDVLKIRLEGLQKFGPSTFREIMKHVAREIDKEKQLPTPDIIGQRPTHQREQIMKPLEIPLERHGLLRISGCDDPGRRLDIVFIHGLGGDSFTTWMADSKDIATFWPNWIAEDFPDVGLWTLGYAASGSKWKEESMPIADRGTQMLDLLVNDGIGERALVFVTHSMGGIVAKQILRHAESYGVKRWESVASKVRGIAFVATPHSGANIANFAELARAVYRTNEQLAELCAHDPRLRELHGWFLNYQNRHKLICRTYCEKREIRPEIPLIGVKLPKGVLVVDETSAEPNIPGERAVPLDEDHISICKPPSRNAQLYKSVSRFLNECLNTDS